MCSSKNTFIRFNIASVFFCLLTACQTAPPPPPRVEIRYQTLALTPPDDLLADCVITAPPKANDYVLLKKWTDKEGVLVATIASHTEQLGACNIRWEKLRQWKISVIKAVTVAQSASAPIVNPMSEP